MVKIVLAKNLAKPFRLKEMAQSEAAAFGAYYVGLPSTPRQRAQLCLSADIIG